MRTVSELEKVSFRTHVRNLNALYLLKTRFLASLRNDKKMNYDTASQAGIQALFKLVPGTRALA